MALRPAAEMIPLDDVNGPVSHGGTAVDVDAA
jgi:hypothetical protein